MASFPYEIQRPYGSSIMRWTAEEAELRRVFNSLKGHVMMSPEPGLAINGETFDLWDAYAGEKGKAMFTDSHTGLVHISDIEDWRKWGRDLRYDERQVLLPSKYWAPEPPAPRAKQP